MIEVSRLKDLNAAELFLGLRIGAVSRCDFAVFPVQGHCSLRRLKGYFGDKMSVGAQMVVVLKAFVERCVSLVLGHAFELSWLDVSQTDVFHPFLLVSSDSLVAVTQSRSSSFCYQIVARETENRQLLYLFSFHLLGMLSNRGRKKAISRMARFAELRGELRWRLLLNRAKDGKPQCTILALFEVKRKFW